MRRKDREITDIDSIISIVKKCDSLNLALFDKEYPYVIPLNFGMSYENNQIILYIHCAKEGRKIDLINRNKKAAFTMSCSHKFIYNDSACSATMKYESVCGCGSIEILSENEKAAALTCIMKQYMKGDEFNFDEKALSAVNILRFTVNNITAKSNINHSI